MVKLTNFGSTFYNPLNRLWDKRKISIITPRITLSWVCPVDFDDRRGTLSLSLKAVVVHNSVKSLIMETNLKKRGPVYCVPCAKSREKLQEFFQSECVLFCK